MEEKKQKNIIKKIFTNIYVVNIFLMVVVFLLILWGILFYLNRYTRHDESIVVPNLEGLSEKDAGKLLESSDFKYEVIDSVYHKDGIPGTILDQIPNADSKVKVGRTIYLTIQAKNEPSINIPDLQYASLRQAEALLIALGFPKPLVKYEKSEFQNLVLGVEYNNREIGIGQKVPKSSVLTIVAGDGFGMSSDNDLPTDTLSDESFFQTTE